MKKLAVFVLVLLLGGCGLPRRQPNTPTPLAVRVVFQVHTGDIVVAGRVTITIDAIDQSGGHGHNADTGLPYPWDGDRTAPYVHTIYYEPGLVIHISATVLYLGKAGQSVSCYFTDAAGVEYPGSRSAGEVLAGPNGNGAAQAHCFFTTVG
jgi:hypothetical protein